MDLEELGQRLVPFCRDKLNDPAATIASLELAPGHAGFAYLFDVTTRGERRGFFLRLPPPNVKLEGTADVMRQVTVLNALDEETIPHCEVLWSGDDPQHFGRPYFVVPKVEGWALKDGWWRRFTPAQCHAAAQEATSALAEIHKTNVARVRSLGEFWGFEFDVTRWDRFYDRAEDQHLLALQPRVRELLLSNIPSDTPMGLYHGDFQWTNLLYSIDCHLLAVIDWELTGIGAVLSDLGWFSLFNEPRAWNHDLATPEGYTPKAAEIEEMYFEAYGVNSGGLPWFKALAAYKFSIITGFNLMLHRRGKRIDADWERYAPSMRTNMEFAMEMLGG